MNANDIIQRIQELGGAEVKRKVWCSKNPIPCWLVKQAPWMKTRFVFEHCMEIHAQGGLLFCCQVNIPPATGAEIWKQDVIFCPQPPEGCDDWIRLGSELGQIAYDFKGLDDEVFDVTFQIAKHAHLIPFNLCSDGMVVWIVSIRDRKALKEVLWNRYIPLIQKMRHLEFSPQKEVAVVMRCRGFTLSLR